MKKYTRGKTYCRILTIVLVIVLTVGGISYCPQSASSDEAKTDNESQTLEGLNIQIAEIFLQKQSLTPIQQKIDWNLLQTLQEINEQGSSAPIEDSLLFQNFSTSMFQINNEGVLKVKLTVSDNVSEEQINQLKSLGMNIQIILPEYGIVEGDLPYDIVETVASLDFVKHVGTPGYPIYNTGFFTSTGDSVLQADTARSTFGINGSGSKIGVMSDGVDHLAASVNSPGGDLPSNIDVVKNGSGDEGTAMLEIIYDLAPGANLAFYGPNTSSDMIFGIGVLEAAGCNIIVDDITFLDEPKFEDGPIAQRACEFVNEGGVYVTSAGNSRLGHYNHQYVRATGTLGYTYAHNYGSRDLGNTFTIPNGGYIIVVLQWNNQWGLSGDDFDLALLWSSNGSLITGSGDTQDGDDDPWEGFYWSNDTGYSVSVFVAILEYALTSDPSSIMLDYTVYNNFYPPSLQYNTTSDSVIGHAAVEEILSTAAVDAATPSTVESYSSCGPGTIYFPSYQQRQVPNITGTDGVQTVTGFLGYFSNPFYGTSAAAPHIAAIAALVWDANPTLNSSQVRSAITSTAVDLSTAGFDYNSGWGRANASAAVNSTVFTLNISSSSGGTVTTPGVGTFHPYIGQIVNISAIPNSCYHFANWSGDTSTIANVSSLSTTITMNDSYSITANFTIDTYTLATTSNGSGGSPYFDGFNPFNCSVNATIHANTSPCYAFTGWSPTDGVANASAENTTVLMTQNRTITANYTLTGATYNLTVNSSEYGNVSFPGEGIFGPYACSTTVNLTTIADTCCDFVNWTGDTASITNPNAASTTIFMNSSKTIQANFILTPWDTNCDGSVNVLDMILIGQHWDQEESAGWIPEDVNNDGTVNVLDMILVGQNWTG
ncbi:MAG: S8 family serine peptidase [Dehalococcoidia bacterium]|jgi:hypothetical protein